MRFLKLLCFRFVILCFFISWGHTAIAGLVRDVRLQSTVLGDVYISAQIVGNLPSSCLQVKEVKHDTNPIFLVQPSLNFHLITEEKEGFCGPAELPFFKEVFVGRLDYNRYTINVFADNELTFSKEVMIPEDVRPISFDFNFSPNQISEYSLIRPFHENPEAEES